MCYCVWKRRLATEQTVYECACVLELSKARVQKHCAKCMAKCTHLHTEIDAAAMEAKEESDSLQVVDQPPPSIAKVTKNPQSRKSTYVHVHQCLLCDVTGGNANSSLCGCLIVLMAHHHLHLCKTFERTLPACIIRLQVKESY